jgi:carbonic anhydrase
MDQLLDGYQRFRQDRWPERRRQFENLADHGQSPRALVVSCADSRVDPAMIFDAGPGELFVIRNVANLVPPYHPDGAHHGTSAALEFGVRVLKVPAILIMGHGLCGGVRALLEGAPAEASDFIVPWIRLATPAKERARARTALLRAGNDPAVIGKSGNVPLDRITSRSWIVTTVGRAFRYSFRCAERTRRGRKLRDGAAGLNVAACRVGAVVSRRRSIGSAVDFSRARYTKEAHHAR